MIEIALLFAKWSLIGFAICFLYYIVLMELHRFFGRAWWVKVLAVPFLVVFDAPLNLTLFTVVCVDLPREWLITSRMKRYRKKYNGIKPSELKSLHKWRSLLRWYICDNHLDKYDSITGDHC